MSKFLKLENLKVFIDRVSFTEQVSDPPLRPFGFIYYITIANETPHSVRLIARKWILREESGDIIVVEGEGIVGEKPLLLPGEKFSYNSCHVVGSSARVRGAFYGLIDFQQRPVMTEIPEFRLSLPV